MSGPAELEVAVRRRVHAGLTLDVALDLGREFGVLTGPSGAGKTTLLRLIAGLEVPDAGTIRVGGVTLTDRARRVRVRLRDRGVGYAFQHDVLFPHLDVAANLRYGLRGRPPAEATARVGAVAAAFGIEALLARRVGTLSGGERQRVGMARAVAPWPRLLLCDEPVSALDLDARYLALDRLRAFGRAEGTPILLVTHAPDEARAVGDRLFVLRAGRVVAGHDPGGRATTLRLGERGPSLVVPPVARAPGGRVFVRVEADEIVLARGPVGTLSAQNLLPGTIERVAGLDHGAEVTVRVGDLRWAVAVLETTVAAMGLAVDQEVTLIIKARSCHPFG